MIYCKKIYNIRMKQGKKNNFTSSNEPETKLTVTNDLIGSKSG